MGPIYYWWNSSNFFWNHFEMFTDSSVEKRKYVVALFPSHLSHVQKHTPSLNIEQIYTPLIMVCSEMIKDGGCCCWLWKGSRCWNNNWCWAEAELRHCHRLTPITLFGAAHFAGSRQIKTQKGSGFWERCLQERQWWIALDVCSESSEIGLWCRAIALGHMHARWL